MINNKIYSWNQRLWKEFCALLKSKKLAHAHLLSGAPGIGKKALATAMAKSLLCESRNYNGDACGHCASCHWIEAGNHPDLRLIRPALVAAQEGSVDEPGSSELISKAAPETSSAEKNLGKDITIDQIRALGDFCSMTATRNGVRVALIYPADSMNLSAANALLKMLEEPGDEFYFFLISDSPHQLLPTLRSRCRTWSVKAPNLGTALVWLKQHAIDQPENKLMALGGAPLTVLELDTTSYWRTQDLLLSALSEPARLDIPGLAKQLETAIRFNEKECQSGAMRALNLSLILGWLQRWVVDILLNHYGIPPHYYGTHQKNIERARVTAGLDTWLNYWLRLNQAVQEAKQPVNLSLFLEDCLLNYPGINLAYKGP